MGDELPLDQVGRPRGLSALADGGLAGLLALDPAQSLGSHQPLDCAPGDTVTLPLEFGMDLPGAVDAEVVVVDLTNHTDQLRVPQRPHRGRTSLGGVVGARGDLDTRTAQGVADRLDPEPDRTIGTLDDTILVVVDVGHDHFSLRSSSAAAKNADAVRRISFARLSSRFSRSSSAIRCASSVVVPV